MGPWRTIDERRGFRCGTVQRAGICRLQLRLFVESDERQAQAILKPVMVRFLCLNGRIFPVKRYLEIGPGEVRLGNDWATLDCQPRAGLVDYVCPWGDEPCRLRTRLSSSSTRPTSWSTSPGFTRWLPSARPLGPQGERTIEVHVPDLDVLIRAVQGAAAWMITRRAAEPGAVLDALGRGATLSPWSRTRVAWRLLQRLPFGVLPAQAGSARLPGSTENAAQSRRRQPGNAGREVRPSNERITAMTMTNLIPTNWPWRGVQLPGFHTATPDVITIRRATSFLRPSAGRCGGGLVSSAVCRQCTHWQEPPPDRFRAFASLRGRLPNQTCMHFGQHTGFRTAQRAEAASSSGLACDHPAHGSTTLEDCRFSRILTSRLA